MYALPVFVSLGSLVMKLLLLAALLLSGVWGVVLLWCLVTRFVVFPDVVFLHGVWGGGGGGLSGLGQELTWSGASQCPVNTK